LLFGQEKYLPPITTYLIFDTYKDNFNLNHRLKKSEDKIFKKKTSVGLIQFATTYLPQAWSVGELIKRTSPSSTFWFWLGQVGALNIG